MQIELLIKKFYEGISTSEEERRLMEYFLNEENVDEHLKKEQQLFRLLHDSQIQIPADVSQRLEESITKMAISSKKSLHSKRNWLYWISSAAAVVILCIGLFLTFPKPAPSKMADTFSDPEEAALVAEQTLAYISVQLNKGLNIISDTGQEFDKVNQLLDKHLNK